MTRDDLHDKHGEHISTPPTANGTAVAAWEKRLRAHLAEKHQQYTAFVTVIRFNGDGEPVEEWMEEGAQNESVIVAVKSASDKVVANITGNASWSYVHGTGTREVER